MKRKLFVSLIALCLLASILTLTACNKNKTTPTVPATTAPTAAAATETAVPATETAAPTKATEAPTVKTTKPTEAPVSETEPKEAPVNNAAKEELVKYGWVLNRVIVNGETLAPNVYYGSIIAQTGAYLEFHEDDTFTCMLGVKGCKGTYETRPGEILAHITIIYDGKSDGGRSVDQDVIMDWNIQQGDISFEYEDGVNNIFVGR